jgi:uncharacterized SAM-binding protein YcdF (DUF218 family)
MSAASRSADYVGPDRSFRRRRLALTLVTVVLAATAIGIEPVRSFALRAAGWALVAQDPVVRADVIVVSAAESAAGVLETAELVRSGIATGVGVFDDPPGEVDRQLLRRGVPYEDAVAISMRQLRSLGIETVESIPKSVPGTEEEARVLPDWCRTRQLQSVVVVTTADHSRRVRRVFNRAAKGVDIKIAVRVARYSAFNPDRWWQTRDGIRTGVIEFQKLLLDLARHPVS